MSSSGLDPASALTFSEISDLNARKKAIKANHAEYVSGHPEIKSMLNDFMSACLLEVSLTLRWEEDTNRRAVLRSNSLMLYF